MKIVKLLNKKGIVPDGILGTCYTVIVRFHRRCANHTTALLTIRNIFEDDFARYRGVGCKYGGWLLTSLRPIERLVDWS